MTPTLEGGTTSGQPAARHFLTLLFSDLCGSTHLAHSIEAEYYADILARLHDTYCRVLPRHGGTVVRIQGDGVLAIFGFPEALENDGRRAAEAALELHAEVRAMRTVLPRTGELQLRLHTGIHAGLVLVSQGDLMRGRFELLGNVPNIAARLSDLAGPDEILASDETLGPERRLFATGSRRSLNLQGLSNPVAVLPVLGRAPETAPEPGRELHPLVNRREELRRLEEALQEVLLGRGKFIAITAAPGLGKTRLAEEFLRRCAAAGCRIHRGYSEGSHGTKPLKPFIQMLRALFGIATDARGSEAAEQLREGLAKISPLERRVTPLLQILSLDDRPAGAGRSRTTAEDMAGALADLFAELAREQPQVIFIDDLHWADDATHRALDSMRLADNAILVLAATRTPEAGAPVLGRAEWLHLQPLSDLDATQHIGQLLPHLDPFLAEQVREHAGGNPLFIEELCHCAANDVEALRDGRVSRGVAWLDVLIESRVTRLTEAQAALVRSASIIGHVIPTWLFERITGHAPDHPAVRELAPLDLVFPGEEPGTLRFKHGITRDAIYESVGLHQRRALHLRIAQALIDRGRVAPGEDHCEALAYHFDAAGQAEQASLYAEQAGDRAMAASALDRAQAQYRAALAALDRTEATDQLASRWNAISQRLGLACVFNPSRSDLPLFHRALALAQANGDVALVAQASYWLGYFHYALGDVSDAVDWSEQALAAAQRAGNDRLAVQVRAVLGQALAAAAQYAPALEILDEVIAIKRAHRSGAGQAVGLAYSLATRGAALGDRGRFAEAAECFDEALEVVRGAKHEVHASIHGLRAAVQLWQGEWDAARASATEAFRIGESVRSIFTLSMGRAAALYAEWMIEGRPESLQMLQRATRWLEPRGVTLFRSWSHGWLADGFASCGNTREARTHAALALRCWRRSDMLGGAMACRAMARLAAREGDGPRAEVWLARARQIAAARDSAHEAAANMLCEGEVALAQGRVEQACAQLDAAARSFSSLRMAWSQANALELLRRHSRQKAALEASVPSG